MKSPNVLDSSLMLDARVAYLVLAPDEHMEASRRDAQLLLIEWVTALATTPPAQFTAEQVGFQADRLLDLSRAALLWEPRNEARGGLEGPDPVPGSVFLPPLAVAAPGRHSQAPSEEERHA